MTRHEAPAPPAAGAGTRKRLIFMIRKVFHHVERKRTKAVVDARHVFLVEGDSLEECSRRITGFLEKYELVRYGSFAIVAEESLVGSSPDFPARLEEAIAENRRRLGLFIAELQDDGINSLQDLASVPEGYQSKTVHTVAHLLDGFFGIDSHFFNLADNSHWLPDHRKALLESAKESHMLVKVRASIWPSG
jgi:hypothetical protein